MRDEPAEEPDRLSPPPHDRRTCTSWSESTSRSRRSSTAKSPGSARATARRSKTRSCASRIASGISCFSSLKGLDVEEIYVNGFSMSLPAELQERLVRCLPGLGKAEMLRPGYAVEYDFIQPTELRSTLEAPQGSRAFSRGPDQRHVRIRGGGGAGPHGRDQRGTARPAREPRFVLGRDEAYIGIMVDDLVTKGCLEPYRMFTSRAEHRLLPRERQRRPAADARGTRCWPRGRRAMGAVLGARGAVRAQPRDGWRQRPFARRKARVWRPPRRCGSLE